MDLSGASKLSLNAQKASIYSSDSTTPILTTFNLLHQTAQGMVEQSKLLRYSLYSPSAYQSQYANSVTELSGYFWMEVPTAISSTGSNIFSLLDQGYISYGSGEYYGTSFNLSPSAMSTGVGVLKTSNRDNAGNPTISTWNMYATGTARYCIECLLDINLNLVGFNYNNGAFAISQVDSRSLLFSSSSYFPGQD